MLEAETARSLPSSAVLFEHGGRFYFFQPGLGVIASGDGVSAAYEKFSDARRAYLDEIERAGLSGRPGFSAVLPPSAQTLNGSVVSRPAFIKELQLFVVKTVIVLSIIGAIGAVAANAISGVVNGISAAVAQIQPLSIGDIADKSSLIVRDMRELPADRREALRQNIGIISRDIQPYLDAWRDPPPASPSNR